MEDYVAAIRERHYMAEGERRTHPDDQFTTDYECATCHTAWPCDAAQLLGKLEGLTFEQVKDPWMAPR